MSNYQAADVLAASSSTTVITLPTFAMTGSNRNIAALAHHRAGTERQITGIVRGTDTYTEAGEFKQGNAKMEVHNSSNEPQTSTATLAITINSANSTWCAGYIASDDVSQTTRINGVVHNESGSAGSLSVNVTSATGDLVCSAIAVSGDIGGSRTLTATGTNHTKRAEDKDSGNLIFGGTGSKPGETTATVGFSWTTATLECVLFGWNHPSAVTGTAPVLTVPGAQTATLGSTKSISGFSFTDTESDVDTITATCDAGATITFDLSGTSVTDGSTNGTNNVSLSGSNAELSTVLGRGIDMDRAEAWPVPEFVDTLTVTVIDATALQDSDTVSVTWTPPTSKYKVLSGTPSAIVAALQALDWTPPTDATGLHNVRVLSVTTVPLSDTDDFTINVQGASPVITVPGTKSAKYDTTVSIPGISVSHSGGLTESVLLECPAAMTMTVDAGSTGATITGNGTNSVLIEDDNETDINTVLGTLEVDRATPVTPVPSNLDPFSANPYSIESNLQVGDAVYSDRLYEFTALPSSLLGATWIQTPNDDKAQDNAATLVFDLNAPAWVYVTLDNRSLELPSSPPWLADWEFVSEVVTNDAPGSVDYSLFRKSFAAGVDTVTLGGYDFVTLYSNYTVIILPIADIVSVTVTATDSNAAIDTATFDVSWSESGGEGGNELPLLHSTRSITDVIM